MAMINISKSLEINYFLGIKRISSAYIYDIRYQPLLLASEKEDEKETEKSNDESNRWRELLCNECFTRRLVFVAGLIGSIRKRQKG